ncbi:methyltransferase family protein [Kumtagia ephedrae]|uniref:Isoprenylcysteine carboxylmethyltransferase family protein n=1 Tax=Kumtagia ephedrae TaxID=2116701 RepID=A0A2P7SH26_9HYPH|nr:isoprenylcysteine carboxylmethyltransferase family protein [Mesorhizobium ephedrae]PSJ61802.1 isoprenylcysteine carboxylmethyltransferase family protein [Mesorhizobium ephedrae]
MTPPNRFPWPPVIYLAAIAVSIVLGIVYPLPWITGPLSDLLFAAGWLVVAAAVAVEVAAFRAFSRARTTVMPTRVSEHLVTTGPFAFTRNPIYLGNTALTIGIGLIVGSLWFLLFAVLAAVTTQKLTIEPEERHLEARFGKKYRDYRARVRRWL